MHLFYPCNAKAVSLQIGYIDVILEDNSISGDIHRTKSVFPSSILSAATAPRIK